MQQDVSSCTCLMELQLQGGQLSVLVLGTELNKQQLATAKDHWNQLLTQLSPDTNR